MEKRYVTPGDVVRLELPHSEVCMHMQVAGTVMDVKLLPTMAQILRDDGLDFSAPITHGEAGFYSEGAQLYCYPVETRVYTMADCAEFARDKQGGKRLEVDEELYWYFLEVLPPYRMNYRAIVVGGRVQPADFGFAEGAEPVTAFWKIGKRYFAQLTTEVSRG